MQVVINLYLPGGTYNVKRLNGALHDLSDIVTLVTLHAASLKMVLFAHGTGEHVSLSETFSFA